MEGSSQNTGGGNYRWYFSKYYLIILTAIIFYTYSVFLIKHTANKNMQLLIVKSLYSIDEVCSLLKQMFSTPFFLPVSVTSGFHTPQSLSINSRGSCLFVAGKQFPLSHGKNPSCFYLSALSFCLWRLILGAVTAIFNIINSLKSEE